MKCVPQEKVLELFPTQHFNFFNNSTFQQSLQYLLGWGMPDKYPELLL